MLWNQEGNLECKTCGIRKYKFRVDFTGARRKRERRITWKNKLDRSNTFSGSKELDKETGTSGLLRDEIKSMGQKWETGKEEFGAKNEGDLNIN